MSASTVSEIVCGFIVVAFIYALVSLKRGVNGHAIVSYAPALLTSLGIFGTFTGIVIGLLAFDTMNIDTSIQGLLAGLKTAFITSLLGIFSSILFKIIQNSGALQPSGETEEILSATPEDILTAINKQNESMQSLIKAIEGDTDGSLLTQVKMLRSDINDNQKIALLTHKASSEELKAIHIQLTNQGKTFKGFSDKLWVKMQDFADMMSKSATEAVIEALKQVIADFNNNLTDQFGDNFKQLNEAVKALVLWQENYKNQLVEMSEQYKQGVISITATEASVSAISQESKIIPQTMTNLKEIMEVNQHQLSELESHLKAFKDIRDRAVEAVPEIQKQIDDTVKAISSSVETASQHYGKLLTESDKYIQNHIKTSNELLNKFVTNTTNGVEIIGAKLADSAQQVEKVITESAGDFIDKVHQTNTSLQTTADHVGKQTEVIKDHLKDTVDDLNRHVREMIINLVDDSKGLTQSLVEANQALNTDTASVRQTVVQSIEDMQKRLEASLDDVFSSQSQHMNKVFSNVDSELQKQVGKTGEAVEKQLSMIDTSMQQELNRVMSEMGKALGQISNQFVKDYSKLVNQMNLITQQ